MPLAYFACADRLFVDDDDDGKSTTFSLAILQAHWTP